MIFKTIISFKTINSEKFVLDIDNSFPVAYTPVSCFIPSMQFHIETNTECEFRNIYPSVHSTNIFVLKMPSFPKLNITRICRTARRSDKPKSRSRFNHSRRAVALYFIGSDIRGYGCPYPRAVQSLRDPTGLRVPD